MKADRTIAYLATSEGMCNALRQQAGWKFLSPMEQGAVTTLVRMACGVVINPDELPHRLIWGDIAEMAEIIATELHSQERPNDGP